MQEGKIYSYKEFCREMGQEIKTGKARQLQLKDWERYFKWEKPTTQQYLIVKIYDSPKEKVDGRKNNGGIRVGAGAKEKLKKEFDILFSGFLLIKANTLNGTSVAYFSTYEIMREFGCFPEPDGTIENVEEAYQEYYFCVMDKIRAKAQTLIIEKMKQRDYVTYGKSVVVRGGKNKGIGNIREDLCEPWINFQDQYCRENGYANTSEVVRAGKWESMIRFITESLNQLLGETYIETKLCHKVEFNAGRLEPYNPSRIKACRKEFNRVLVKETYDYFRNKEWQKEVDKVKRYKIGALTEEDIEQKVKFDEEKVMQPYRYILDKYVALT